MKMDKETYPKWVGVILGLILSGSAHFLAGRRATGLKWCFGLLVCPFVAVSLAAIPGTITYICGSVVGIAGLVLWFVMLKQSYRTVPRIGFLGWLALIALSIVLGLTEDLVTRQVIHPFSVPTRAMAPTLLPGDFVLVERLSYRFGEPARGDVVVFSTDAISHSDVRPNSFYIKRVAGLPGERIQIEPPNLLVNGDNVDTPPIMKNISSKTDGYEGFLLAHGNTRMKPVLTEPNDAVVLGEDEYFLLGDNTEHSLDSRYFGPVSGKSIIGRVTRIYYPFKRINELK